MFIIYIKQQKTEIAGKKLKNYHLTTNTYSLRDPSLSADGSTLYFASNMPNGFGMYDLYKVTVNADGTFGDTRKLRR